MNVMQGWMSNFELLPHTIFLTLAGSHAYGLNTPESDIDLRGIAIPPKDYIFGFSKRFEQCEKKGDSDVVIYNIDKFFNLASNANPSIMELLWTEPRFHVITTKYSEMLMEVRELFLSKKVAFTFTGYAHSQLKRIKTHRAWLLNPPTHKPTREEFGLTQTREVSRDQEGAFKSVMSRALGMEAEKVIIENIEPSYLPKNTPLNFLEYLTKENRYDSAMDNWKSYENWKANRNPARAILEERFGYDCYHPDTEFLTECGWKKYDEIDETFKLATINKKSKQIEYQYFSNRIQKPFSGKLYLISNQNSTTFITPTHNLFVSKMHRQMSNNFSSKYNEESSNWELIPANKLKNGKFSHWHCLAAVNPSQSDYPIEDDYLRIMGLYCSEGSLIKYAGKNKERLKGVSISQLENPNKIESIVDRITSYDVAKHIHFRKNRNEITYNIYNQKLAELILLDCGQYSKKKKLPLWIRNLSERQVDVLLTALLSGDGTQKKHSSIYYTSSKALRDSVNILALHGGYTSKTWSYVYDNREIHQVYIKKRKEKEVSIRKNNIKEVEYNGTVVCFEVLNETLITRYNGEISFHGNCKHASHLVRLMKMGKEILTTGKVKVFRDDAEIFRDIRQGRWEYDQLIEWMDTQEAEIMEFYKFGTSPIPKTPDIEKLNDACVKIQEAFLSGIK